MNGSMTIYLSGAIDDISPMEAQGWRRKVISSAPAGVLFFDPSRAWGGASHATAQAVDIGNRIMIHHCDGVLVNLTGAGRAFGTIREIEWARVRGIPVAVASTEEIVSLMAHDLFLCPDVDSALTQLVKAIREKQDRPPAGIMFHFPGLSYPGPEDDD